MLDEATIAVPILGAMIEWHALREKPLPQE